jgi:hypothetical protein
LCLFSVQKVSSDECRVTDVSGTEKGVAHKNLSQCRFVFSDLMRMCRRC